MFTLKIAHTGSADCSASWIGDVVTVHLIDTGSKTEALERWEPYRRNHDNLVDHSTFLPGDRDVALLCVVLDGGHDRYLIVGRSWLLNSHGETVERITP